MLTEKVLRASKLSQTIMLSSVYQAPKLIGIMISSFNQQIYPSLRLTTSLSVVAIECGSTAEIMLCFGLLDPNQNFYSRALSIGAKRVMQDLNLPMHETLNVFNRQGKVSPTNFLCLHGL